MGGYITKSKASADADGSNSGEKFIIVRRLIEKQIKIPILPSDTVKDVKTKIEALEGIPVDKQTLDFAGLALNNDETALSQMGIKHEDTIHVMEKTCTRGWIQIFIKSPTETFPFGVCQQSTVMNLKKKIEEKIGMATSQQRLVFRGKLLSNFYSLASSEVKQGCVVELYPPRYRKVTVRTSDGSSRVVEVEDVDTVLVLKQKIFKHWHVAPSSQDLNYLDNILENHKMVMDYGMKDGSVILMTEGEEEEGEKIWVTVMNGSKEVKMEAESHTTILALKKMLKDTERIPVEDQRLSLNQKKLLDFMCLADAGIDGTTIIDLHIRRPLKIRIFRDGTDRGIVTVDANDYVTDLKQAIARKFSYSTTDMKLEFDHEILDNNRMISSYGIRDRVIVRFEETSRYDDRIRC